MSIHIHPALRAREDALKGAGLIVAVDSAGYLALKYQEDLGATFRQSPKATYLFNGTSFYPSTIPVHT
jgi:hypothetical protein